MKNDEVEELKQFSLAATEQLEEFFAKAPKLQDAGRGPLANWELIFPLSSQYRRQPTRETLDQVIALMMAINICLHKEQSGQELTNSEQATIAWAYQVAIPGLFLLVGTICKELVELQDATLPDKIEF